MVDKKKTEEELLLNHEYDGIRELDNDLPPWWINLFYMTIVFGVIYLLGYQVFDWFDSQKEEYKKEMTAHELLLIKNDGPNPVAIGGSDDNKKAEIAAGEVIFKTNCVVCHKALGEGGIGPNLTDKYWLHGGDLESVQKTISEGVPAKGMLAWKPILGAKSVYQVSMYVLSLQGTNPPDAKAPEGILIGAVEANKPASILTDKDSLEKGALLYQQYCGACHGEDKKGGFASSLVDNIWKQGNGSLEDVIKITAEGNESIKMPGWKSVLTDKQIQEVSSFILNNSKDK